MRKLILAAILVGYANLHAQTVLIRNKPVDLSPVVKWLEKKEGERPMPHWKAIEIENILAKEWGGYRVSVKVDGASYKAPIVIQNIPDELLKLVAADDATSKSMADIEAKIAVLERQNMELERQKELTVREYGTAYESAVAQLQANEVVMAGLRTEYLNQQQTLSFTSEAKKSKLLAYFTGQKVGPHEVWDCGTGSKILKAQQPPR
jgi:hypothetical protein